MAPPVKQNTLPADFFQKNQQQDTLPSDFKSGEEPPDPLAGWNSSSTPTGEQWLYNHEQYKPIKSFGDAGEDAGIAARNFGRGMLQAPYRIGKALTSNPIDTVKGMYTSPESLADVLTFGAYTPAKDVAEGKGAETLGQMASGYLMGKAGSGLGRVVNPYKSSVVPSAETNAENLMKAILPQEGVTPGNVRAAMSEAPAIRAFAQRTNNPLKTIPEGMKAAEGVAGEGLNHYRQNLLGPNANERVTLENGMSPELGNTATLGQIEKRLSDINDVIRGATSRAKSGGAELTALERQGMEREAGTLRQKLYQGISEKTGVSPEDIQALREGYGGQYAIKNALESGHYGRLTESGRTSQGMSAPTSRTEVLAQLLRRGPFSQESIANRQFARAIKAFAPQEPEYFQSNPPSPTPYQAPPVSPEMEARISAVGTGPGVQPRPTPPVRPLNGPMAKAPVVAESERVADAFQKAQNEAFAARRAANQAAAQARKPAGMGPTQPPSAEVVEPPANYTRDFMNKIRTRAGEGRAASVPPPEPPTQPNPLDRFLGAAREIQSQARTLRRKP